MTATNNPYSWYCFISASNLQFIVKWSAKEYEIELPTSTGTVLCLKKAIENQTGVMLLYHLFVQYFHSSNTFPHI